MRIEGKQEGVGGINELQIDNEGRAVVSAHAQSSMAHHSIYDGDVFIIATDFLTFSAAAEGAALYVKNTSPTKPVHVGAVRTCSDVMGNIKWTMNHGATSHNTGTGTQTTATAENMNTQSNLALSADLYAGTNGTTVTGGTQVTQWIDHGPGHSVQDFEGGMIIGPGDSMSILATPSATGDLCLQMIVWYD